MKKWSLFIPIILGGCAQTEEFYPDVEGAKDNANVTNFISLTETLENGEREYENVFGQGTRAFSRSVLTVDFHGQIKPTRSSEEMGGFYVVNYKGGGFALLSADRRREPVYAISEEGFFNLSDTCVNENLSWYINSAIPMMDRPSVNNEIGSFDSVPSGIRPLDYMEVKARLTGFHAKFHQRSPYNKFCPDFNGSKSLVGCAPLAVGTICSYYNWPEEYKGHRFNWKSMDVNVVDDSWARLFAVAGLPENMDTQYSDTVSYSNIGNYVRTFTNLGYKNTFKVSFSKTLVWRELYNGDIVLARGLNREGTSGHAWVIDGGYVKIYDNSGSDFTPIDGETTIKKYYFNCVWGWNGIGNGYYYYDDSLGGVPASQSDEYYGNAPEYTMLEIVFGFDKNI